MVKLTLKAEQKIKTMLSKRGKGIGIRLGVKTTGCSGLAYVLEYADTFDSSDEQYAYSSFMIVIDKKSLVYLHGLEIDYVKNGLNEGFEFKNPNEKAKCGCGASFTV